MRISEIIMWWENVLRRSCFIRTNYFLSVNILTQITQAQQGFDELRHLKINQL